MNSRLTLIEDTVRRIQNRNGKRYIKVADYFCKCGVVKTISIRSITRGTKSCGCLQREQLIERNTTHGLTDHPIHRTWRDMKQRCYNSSNCNYYKYGARGITVCDRWLNSFESFLEDMGEKPSPRHSIDRIHNDGNYTPDNCMWATAKEQANNRRPKTKKLSD